MTVARIVNAAFTYSRAPSAKPLWSGEEEVAVYDRLDQIGHEGGIRGVSLDQSRTVQMAALWQHGRGLSIEFGLLVGATLAAVNVGVRAQYVLDLWNIDANGCEAHYKLTPTESRLDSGLVLRV